MQYKCQECNDTGSRDKLGTYLDCNACGTAATRRDLNDFVKSLGPTHPEDVALAIHQRALAMAPKQEAPAGWKLVPEDPTGEMFRAAAKIDNEMFAGGSSHGAEDGQIWAAMYDAAPEAPVAAPAAANGALPELPEPTIDGTVYHTEHKICYVAPVHFTADQMRAYGKACAAAGPDAALIEAARNVVTCFNDPHTSLAYVQRWVNELAEVLALSGAKGN